ncbi:MAG: nucleotide sugar dehydrogenase, partial [Saprospiraceae bacterium]|nr:nucleotide sugar dehydrogenase [Saprospiraceae bacterium]
LARKFSVIGFDHTEERISLMKKGIDPSKELAPKDFEECDIQFTSRESDLAEASFYITTVPTPVDAHKVPDLSLLIKACHSIGRNLSRGDYVIFESTVYPGCTEDDCLPILESESGLKAGKDFKLGYSPERINPGDQIHTVHSIPKVISALDQESLAEIEQVYSKVIPAGVFKASSIKVAEAAKVIENTQRDLNISFVNELSIIFDKMDINTQDVLEAASTKWNFLQFLPGLVGGHCIGVDPYYLLHKAKQLGYDPQVILSGRRINDSMPAFVAKKLVQMLIHEGKHPKECNVLIMGITFKENVSDIRNSKVADLVYELMGYSVNVDVVDPHASPSEVNREYDFELSEHPGGDYDAIIVAVGHDKFRELDLKYFADLSNAKTILLDVKGIYRNENTDNIKYWSL